ITVRRRAEQEVRYQALHDPITGLANRVLFGDHLDAALARHVRSGRRLGVLFLDLDRFKVTNDSLGHAAGDLLLRQVAGRLRGAVRPGDTTARLGGDEFAVLLEDVTADADVTTVADRIRMLFASPFQVEAERVTSTCSIGIATTDGQLSGSDLLRHADAALYRAKERGRGRYEIFDEPMQHWLHARQRTEHELGKGLAEGEIEVHYQPLRALTSTGVGSVTGYEALARWRHPRRGLLPAGEFIDLAEESGLVHPLGAAALDQVGRQQEQWARQLRRNAPAIAVNLSPHQLALPSIVDLLTPAAQHGQLWIEITETALMTDVSRVSQRLRDLRRLGIRVAVDDFGTGHSSLAYLKRFPTDAIKIDRTFVDRLGEDADDTAIVRAIINLGHTLGVRVIAEGVERPTQLSILRELECDAVQGYLTGRPAPAEALSAPLLG
ncbi:MAG TPA: EAL domain-containing protein, partial [Kineosporiaceae bacterium]|nr:EAL domain-containing protein [Kineosporiaceae bacterium]